MKGGIFKLFGKEVSSSMVGVEHWTYTASATSNPSPTTRMWGTFDSACKIYAEMVVQKEKIRLLARCDKASSPINI
jgi:hypothetical protein